MNKPNAAYTHVKAKTLDTEKPPLEDLREQQNSITMIWKKKKI